MPQASAANKSTAIGTQLIFPANKYCTAVLFLTGRLPATPEYGLREARAVRAEEYRGGTGIWIRERKADGAGVWVGG